MASPTSRESNLETLLAAGDLYAAATLLRDRGELPRARDLFARISAFADAAAIARGQGDLVGELSFVLPLGDAPRIAEILRDLQAAPAALRAQAAAVCETAGALREAAELRRALGETDAASRLFARAGDHLGMARLAEAGGEGRRAIEAYRRFLHSRASITPSPVLRDELLAAHRGCARLLCRIGEVESALPHLQAARRLLLPPRREDVEALQSVEAELIDAFLLLDEPELALRLYGQHAAWCPAARRAGGPVEYARERAQDRQQHAGAAGGDEALFLRRYRLGPLLGSGSVGRVYLADDLFTARRVALKLLALAGAGSAAGGQLYARFCREATLLSRLRHPRLVRIEGFHATAGALALEYMAGGAASQSQLPLPLAAARRLLLDILEALAVMHAAGVLHRDVKPHNIFLDDLGGAKLGDFGIATLKDLGVTQTEGLVGTLAYMAPEQIRSTTLSVATDLYGLAVSAFELVTGTLPFSGPDFIAQHLDAPPPDARRHRPELPAEWALLLLRLLQKDPSQRMHSIERLSAEVAALPTQEPPRDANRRPLPPPPVSAVLVSTDSAAPTGADAASMRTSAPLPAVAAGRTAHSALWVTTEARLGRTVVVERFAPGLLQGPQGAAQLTWLRRMAALAGPGLQRILHIRLSESDGLSLGWSSDASPSRPEQPTAPPAAEVVYEYLGGWPSIHPTAASEDERRGLLRVLSRLHQAGVVHGAVAQSLVREPGQICLLVQGCGPLSQPAQASQGDEAGASQPLPPDPETDLSALR